MIRGDMADDGQAGPGAAGVAAAGAVDPVEALEDPFEVAAGDADAVVAHGDVDPGAVGASPDVDRVARLAVLHGVVQEVRHGGHQLAAVPHHGEPGRRRLHFDLDAALLGRGPDAVGRVADEAGPLHLVGR